MTFGLCSFLLFRAVGGGSFVSASHSEKADIDKMGARCNHVYNLEFALSEGKDSFCQSFPALCCHDFIHKVCHIHLAVPIF